MPSSVHSQDQDQSMLDAQPEQTQFENEEFEMEKKPIVVVSAVSIFLCGFWSSHVWVGLCRIWLALMIRACCCDDFRWILRVSCIADICAMLLVILDVYCRLHLHLDCFIPMSFLVSICITTTSSHMPCHNSDREEPPS